MKQGTDFVYVKFSTELVRQMGEEWSRPVQVRLEEDWSGDITLVTRDVASVTLRDLKEAL